MEFPKLHKQTEKRIAEVEDKKVRLAEKIKKARQVLEKFDATVRNKRPVYEKCQQLYTGDPEAAKEHWEKMKLGITCERWQKKWEMIEALRSRLKELPGLKMQLEEELPFDETNGELDKIEKEREKISRKIKKEEELLEKLSSTVRSKQPAYERYQQLYAGDPEAAEDYWEKKKLGVTWDRRNKKEREVWALEDRQHEIPAELDQLREELGEIVGFNPMQEQSEHPVVKKEFYFAENRWRIRNSKLKFYQDWLTPPKFRIRPRADNDSRYRDTPYDDIPLQFCVANPQWIPNWLLEEYLGIELPKNLTPFQKMQRKTDAIPNVADFVQNHLTPLPIPIPGYDKKFNYRLLVVNGFSPDHDGKIFYPRYKGTAPEHKDRKIVQVYESAYAASRKAEYVKGGYKIELRQITAIEERIKSIHKKVLSIRADDPQKEDKKKEAREKLNEEAELLQYLTNYYKHSAYGILKKTMDLKDIRGIDNPGAACARLLRFLKVFKARFPQIFKRSGFTHEDENTLTMIIAEAEAVLEQYFDGFKNVCEKIAKTKKTTLFKDTPDERLGNQKEYVTNAILGDLNYLSDPSKFNIRPFNFYAAKLQEKIEAIKAGIQNRDYKTTRQEAIKAFVVCKIFKVQKELEGVIREISVLPLETDIGVLLEKANRLYTLIEAREVFPNIEVESYRTVYSELEKEIGKMVGGLKYYQSKKPSPEERQEIYQRMKKYLEDIDFPAILAKLD